MEFQTLRQQLKDGIHRKLYVFHGEEQDVLWQYVHKIAAANRAWSIIRHTHLGAVMAHMLIKSIFAQRRVFVIEGTDNVPEITFESLQSMLLEGDTLILIYDKIDKRKKFFLDAGDNMVEFKHFTSDELRGYIRTKLPISDRLALALAEWCGEDVARIDSEIDKLKRLDEKITQDVLEDLIVPSPEESVFEMVDALAKKELARAYDLYEDLIQQGESPVKLVALLYSKFRQMFLVQSMMDLDDGEIAAKTKLNKWAIGHVREVLGEFSLQGLMDALRLSQQTEVAIKTGQIDTDLGFHRLILGVGARDD